MPEATFVPGWVQVLPAVNATLNGIATLLLVSGYVLIRRGQVETHKRVMLTAFAVSVAFLCTYLVYHYQLDHYTGASGKKFPGTGVARSVYLTILISHVVLAALVPFLALITLYRGLRGQFERHRRIARITFPIWVYVSVTGVIIYVMVYHWPLAWRAAA